MAKNIHKELEEQIKVVTDLIRDDRFRSAVIVVTCDMGDSSQALHVAVTGKEGPRSAEYLEILGMLEHAKAHISRNHAHEAELEKLRETLSKMIENFNRGRGNGNTDPLAN